MAYRGHGLAASRGVMARYLGTRLLSVLPVLFGASVFAFLLAHLAPGDETSVLLGPYASPQARAALSHQLGLNEPLPVQYLRWLGRALRGDLGTSVQLQSSVSSVLATKFANTLLLGAASFVAALVLGLLAGFISPLSRGRWLDRAVQGTTALFAYIPVFLLGVILVYVFSIKLDWLPASGMGPSAGGGSVLTRLQYLVLPVVATAGIPGAIIAMSTANAVRRELTADYVRSARAQGLAERTILRRYVFRSVLPSILHVSGLQFAYLLTGSLVFTEVVFNWPGIGLQVYNAVTSRDIPMIQGIVLLSGVVFVVVNLVVDVLHALVDPRSRQRVDA